LIQSIWEINKISNKGCKRRQSLPLSNQQSGTPPFPLANTSLQV
jgi:hypothetical protein